MTYLLTTLALAGVPAEAESSSLGLLGGGSPKGEVAIGLRGGYPSLGVQAQLGFAGGWTGISYFDTQLFRRTWVGMGVGKRWLEGRVGVLSGEALLGVEQQSGIFPSFGPSGLIRLKMAHPGRVLLPYLELSTRVTLLGTTTVTEKLDGTSERTWVADARCVPSATLGLGWAIRPWIGMEFGLDWMYDTRATVSIPGAHLGLGVGW